MKIVRNSQCPKIVRREYQCSRRARYPVDERGLVLTCWQHRTQWAKDWEVKPIDHLGHIGTAIEGGNISQAIGLGSRYLAVRAPRGSLVRLCAARCVVMTSTDYGPSSKIRPPRIADVALGVWLRVCDKPASAGVCRGSVEYLAPPHTHIELPATDTE